MKSKSLNSFADHAPKVEWFRSFFALKNDFFSCHSLGPMQISCFRRFLRDAELITQDRYFTRFAEIANELAWDSTNSLGLMLINLVANNPQIRWYVENLALDKLYELNVVDLLLSNYAVSPLSRRSIIYSFKRIVATPFGSNLHFGFVETEGKRDSVVKLSRTKCVVPDSRVILYGLYKYAEQCQGVREYSFERLLERNVETSGVSPCQIFGLSADEIKGIALGLSINYPNFIRVETTRNLERIVILFWDKTSSDVLDLFIPTARSGR